MAKDFYETLGVPRSGSKDDMKKAYRKLAVKYHPDKNPDDEKAEGKFKEISTAYEVLSDSGKRKMYDRVGHEAYTRRGSGAGGAPGGFTDPSDLFSQVFGGGGGGIFDELFGGGRRQRRTGPQPGADLRYDLHIDFEDAVYGTDKQVDVAKAEACERCRGEGVEPGSRKTTCNQCGGSGQITMSQGFFSVRQICHTCSGTGEVIERQCSACSGHGRVQRTKKIEIHIPAGVDTGSRLRVSGEGEAGQRGGPPGDLYIVLLVEEHGIFKRSDDDVLVDLPVDYTTAALGGTISVPTISGMANLKIPAGTQTGSILRMRGKGIPSIRHQGRGDQHVHITVEIPKNLNREQREKLKEFAELCDNDVHPMRERFLKKVKKMFK